MALSILKLITRPGEITSGEINWNAEDVLKVDDKRLRAIRGGEIAMIFQDPFSSLNPVFTIENQLEEAVMLHEKVKGKGLGVKGREIELLRLVHLDRDVLNKYPHELSGGMRQRVMIAMALAGDPKLLIADEPTTALDVTIQAEILKLLKEIQTNFKMSIILITHNLSLVWGFCDEVCIMEGGRVVEAGSTQDIFKSPKTQYTDKLLKAIPRPKWKINVV